jgi:membrane dipeptidase
MKRGYKGYKSFEYLEPGVDYQEFELVPELNRVEPYVVPLDASQEARAAGLVEKCVVISLHDHPNVFPLKQQDIVRYAKQGREATAFEALGDSPLDAVFDAMMDGTCIMSSDAGWRWIDVLHDIGIRSSDIAHQDFLIRTERLEDIYRAKKEDKIAWIIALEQAGMIENELDRLDVLYGLGVRMIGITYSESNSLGSGIREVNDGGLTHMGRKAVERMNKLGLAIETTHCGMQTARDVMQASKKPVFITHTGARALWERRGLKPDDLLKACADTGGVVGIGAPPHSTPTRNHPVHGIDSVMEHFEYIKNLIGVDHVGFGPDTLYGDHVGLHEAFAANLSLTKDTFRGDPVPHVDYVKGMENPTEAWNNIVRWLVKEGYSDEDICKVLGGNALRALQEVWY